MVYHGGGLFKWLLVSGLSFCAGVVDHAGFACGRGVVGHRVEGWLWALWAGFFNSVWKNKIFHSGGFGVYILVYT